MISYRQADLLDTLKQPLAYINITHERVGLVKEIITVYLILKTRDVAKSTPIVAAMEEAAESLPPDVKKAYNRDSGHIMAFRDANHILSYETLHGKPSSEFIATHFVRSLKKHPGIVWDHVNESIGPGASVIDQFTIYPDFLIKRADLLPRIRGKWATFKVTCDFGESDNTGLYRMQVSEASFENKPFTVLNHLIRPIFVDVFGFQSSASGYLSKMFDRKNAATDTMFDIQNKISSEIQERKIAHRAEATFTSPPVTNEEDKKELTIKVLVTEK